MKLSNDISEKIQRLELFLFKKPKFLNLILGTREHPSSIIFYEIREELFYYLKKKIYSLIIILNFHQL